MTKQLIYMGPEKFSSD